MFSTLKRCACVILLFSSITVFAQIPDYTVRTASHIGGWVNHAAVISDYAFIGQGNSIGVFDLNQPDLIKVKSFPFDNEVQEILPNGQTAIIRVSSADSALLFLNLSDLNNPEIVGAAELPGSWVAKMHACPAYVGYAIKDSLWIVDHSNPANPQILTKLITSTNALYCTDAFLYVVGGDSLKIFDMANPAMPQQIGSIYAKNARAITVQNNHAFVGIQDNTDFFFGVRIYDLDDKGNPAELGSFPTKIVDGNTTFHLNTKFVRIQNNIMYVTAVGDGSWLFFADISDPANPTEIGRYKVAGNHADVKSLDIAMPYAYLASGERTTVFVKLDISDLMNIQQVGNIQAPLIVNHIATTENTLFVASWENFFIYQFDTPDQPRLLKTLPECANMKYIASRPEYTLGIRNDTLFVINTKPPETAGIATRLVFPGYSLLKIALRDSTQAYVVTWEDDTDSRLISIDIIDPENPLVQSDIAVPGQGRDVHAPNNSTKVYLAYSNGENDRGFKIYDMVDPENPQEITGEQTKYDPVAICGTDSSIFVASNKFQQQLASLMKSNALQLSKVDQDSGIVESYTTNTDNMVQRTAYQQYWGYMWDLQNFGNYLMASSPYFGMYHFNTGTLGLIDNWSNPNALFFCPMFFCGSPFVNLFTIHGYYDFAKFWVDASTGIKTTQINYTPQVKSVKVDSGNVVLNQGDQYTFTATGHDRWGNETETNLEWSATGGEMNPQTGEYKATQTGTFLVYCRDSRWDVTSDSGMVTVNPASLVENTGMPQEFELLQNYPNPFNPQTTIAFTLPEQADVTLKIYDIRGAQVRTLIQGKLSAGYHSVIWHGVNDQGQISGSGSYIYKLESENRIIVKKMVYLR